MSSIPEKRHGLHHEQLRRIKQLEVELWHVERKIGVMQHDIRTPLQTLSHGIQVSVSSPDMRAIMGDAIAQIGDTIEHTLSDVRKNISCASFCDLLREAYAAVLVLAEKSEEPEGVQVNFSAEEAEEYFLFAAGIHWQNILQNLMQNAFRKRASHLDVHLGWSTIAATGQKAIEITVRDNGDGMTKQILDDVRSNRRVTDKTIGDGLIEGEQHGVGLQGVRLLVEELYGGEMHVDSTHVLDDPDHHGTTFIFRLPVYVYDENGEPVIETAACAGEARKITRREALRLLGGGLALTAAGIAGIAYQMRGMRPPPRGTENVRPLFPEFPLSDIRLDERGRIAGFTLDTNEERLPVGGDSVRRVDLPDSSLLSFDRMTPDGRLRRMFLHSSQEGVFGFVRIAAGGESRASYVCAPAIDGRVPPRINREHLYPLEDTVVLPDGHAAVSMEMLEAGDFSSMLDALKRFSAHTLDDAPEDERQIVGTARMIIDRLLTLYALHAGGAQRVTTVAQWRAFSAGMGRLLLLDRDTAERPPVRDALTRRGLADLRRRGNHLGFLGTKPDELPPLLHHESGKL